jgi:2-C-methyl-D-erythritol 2,4-cyclodiphosphate synthase
MTGIKQKLFWSSGMDNRMGIGYDVHVITKGESLVLGGVEIPHGKGTRGHSDGDVLIHAVVDALLGAAGLGDIGKFFPSDDDTWKDVSSLLFLEKSAEMLKNAGTEIVNVDSTIIIQEPRITPHIDKMIKNVADALSVEPNHISIKATTTDGLGITGRGEGVAALAVASLIAS